MVKQVERGFAALADGTRQRMVERLSRGEATVSQLAEPLAISLPAVLKHLGVLEEAGIVSCTKTGRTRWCRLEPRALERMSDWIERRRRTWEKRLDNLGRIVEEGR